MLSAQKIQYFARRINSKFIFGEVKQEMPGKQKLPQFPCGSPRSLANQYCPDY
jgi:hypothetical protein